MEELIARQSETISQLRNIKTNFGKDSVSRKTPDYINKRLDIIHNLWGEFNENHQLILKNPGRSTEEYFRADLYGVGKSLYDELRKTLSSFGKSEAISVLGTSSPYEKTETGTQPDGRCEELLSLQRAQFRAFHRLIKNIDLSNITEKWEIEDELKNINIKWKAIDELHVQIDNILAGGDINYEDEFLLHESKYKSAKRSLNQKLESNLHMKQCTPQLEIPIFTGKFTNWPTFFDLFMEIIHNNKNLSKAQKLQHLKSKVKGKAERIIQHLHISAENYDTAWDILVHRYSNLQLLFSKNVEILLNQPTITKQTSYELRKLYDTTNECVHAIRNLGVDTNSWDPLIVHLLCKKLDYQTFTDYKESRQSPRELPTFEEFMTFLENKFIALEPIYKKEKEGPSTSSVPNQNIKRTFQYQSRKPMNKQPYFQTDKTYQIMATNSQRCALCQLDHDLFACKQFLTMTPDARYKTVVRLDVCTNCLYKHYGKPCTSTKRCKDCNGKHNTYLHDPARVQSTFPTGRAKQRNVYHVGLDDKETLLPTAFVYLKASDGTLIKARALLDQSAQISIISENLVQHLGLKRHNSKISTITGIDLCRKKCNGSVWIELKSTYDDYHYQTEARIVSKVANDLPNTTFDHEPLGYLHKLSLADPRFNVSQRVDILLGGDVYSDIIMNGLVKGPPSAPIAQETKLGWIISGSVTPLSCYAVAQNINQVSESNIPDLAQYWEIEDINNPSSTLTESEKYCEDFYQQTTERLQNGRYVVALPMKPDYKEQLGSSKIKAIAQFKQLENRLSKNTLFAMSYKQFMREYYELGHMRKVSSPDNQTVYIPHHGVLKLDSETTKLRVVFNASSKTSTGKSLNDVMHGGPNLQQDLQAIILKWRTYKYVITADIEKMFRQILIREKDQHLQCIIWRESLQDNLQQFYLCTVSYGCKSSPWLAMRTLKQLAKDEAENYPLAAAAIQKSCYMDDILTGNNSLEIVKQTKYQLNKMFQSAKMNLRKWSSNNTQLLRSGSTNQDNALEFKSTETRKTLGLKWNPISDSFTYQNQMKTENDQRLTKKQLLSKISLIFDPLGWLSPLSVRAKLLFQTTWSKTTAWDDEVSTEIEDQWIQLCEDLKDIEKFNIPRHVGNTQKTSYLHAFCDASITSYACCLYLVTDSDKGEFTSTLIAAKTKLAPLAKKVSLPRLELLAALLLSQLVKKVMESFSELDIKIHAWTDSMIVLGWLHGDITRWKSFVANRIRQIKEVIAPSSWRHVRSQDNPADCATRGLTSNQLSDHNLWWGGPEWLPTFKADESNIEFESTEIETKRSCVYATLHRNDSSLVNELLATYSSLSRVTKVLGWVLRFTRCARDKHYASLSHENVLTPCELNEARYKLIKEVQGNDFMEDLEHIKKHGHVASKSKLLSLNPFIDDQGLLRVGGRLGNADIRYSAKHPIILSTHGRLTDLVIHQAHMTTLHGGPRLTLAYIRNQYWIISGIRTVKRQLRQCVRCRRFSSENHQNQHIMAELPKSRTTISRAFSRTAVDFTGFVELKINKGRGIKTCKGYIAVFVCLTTKAIHLELVSDLSTPTFLAAFRRFCARRGTPAHMYSDNGTNFIGADRLLKQEYKEIMQNINSDFFNCINDFNIIWHKNAPCWPSAGGLWESAVKSMKYHLRRVLGDQRLTYEEFTTLLHQIEACLNSRPLCQLIESPDDDYLTPGHFLIGGPILSRPQTEPDSITLSKRWQLVQTMNKHFWKKWSNEYLQQLQTRTKWRTHNQNIKIDDIVLIKEDNLPPGKFALGRVQELHPGQDGNVRVVTLKTSSNIIKRPVTKVIILPIREEEQNKEQEPEATQQPSTSAQDLPNRMQLRPRPRRVNFKNFFITMFVMFTVLIPPSIQQSSDEASFNISKFNGSQNLFFDKISDMQFIKDEWKLVVYYNMSTYYQGISNLRNYINHIKENAKDGKVQYQNILSQLEHEIEEIDHYNKLLLSTNVRRQKRGLINGVGYLANSLFGVLDDRFAEQYKQDLEKIVINENHLQSLMKNQTSVLESEYNILKRNEKAMAHQFKFIKALLYNMTLDENRISYASEIGLYITSSALTANIILNTISRMQQTLISTVTDISQGQIDPHLLMPEEMENQLNIISRQLKSDIVLPVDQGNIKDIYKLIKVSARIYDGYLLIETKIPLLSSSVFELNKIITIPRNKDNKSLYLSSAQPYIAYNLKKDSASLLSENDLQQCIRSANQKLLCPIQLPIYDLQLKQSLCDIKLLSTNSESTCQTYVTNCRDQWIKLHRPNDWLFACCTECHVRILCPAGVTIKQLSGAGLITLGDECKLKGSGYTIYTHHNFISRLNIETKFEAPEVSLLNKIINTTALPSDEIFDTSSDWDELFEQIKLLKEQSSYNLSVHDVHHYAMMYVIICILIIGVIVAAVWRLRRNRSLRSGRADERTAAAPRPRPRILNESELVRSVSDQVISVSEPVRYSVVKGVQTTGTSPIAFKSKVYHSSMDLE